MLPLSGQPQLTIIGREVNLGGNYADLIAIDESGQIVVIEVKLRDNAESRRAVIAQILTYAAVLHGMSPIEFHALLSSYIAQSDSPDLADAVEKKLQTGPINRETFEQVLESSLRDGQFRLVIVLDRAPSELIRLVGYLDSVAAGLTLDLIVVSSFTIGGQQIIIPQRIEPEKHLNESQVAAKTPNATAPKTTYEPGSQAFEQSIANAKEEHRPDLQRLLIWARSIEEKQLATLRTAIGSNRFVLTPALKVTQTGFVSLYNYANGIGIDIFPKVLEKWAPNSIAAIEAALAAITPTSTYHSRQVTDELLAALTKAYEEAVLNSKST